MRSAKFRKLDDFKIGFIAGVIGPFFGFLLCSWYFTWKFAISFNYFFNDIFLGAGSSQAEVITLSLLFNLILFFGALQKDLNKAAKGVIGSLFIYAPIILYFKFFH